LQQTEIQKKLSLRPLTQSASSSRRTLPLDLLCRSPNLSTDTEHTEEETSSSQIDLRTVIQTLDPDEDPPDRRLLLNLDHVIPVVPYLGYMLEPRVIGDR
jgi:hypothetical protein